MRKNFMFVALTAVTLLCACGKKDDAKAQNNEKPRVKIERVSKENVAILREYSTTVEAMQKNSITPNSPLRIEKIYVEVGDMVKKGQKLVQLDAKDLDKLKIQYEYQLTEFKRVEALHKAGGISKADFENAKTQLDIAKKTLDSRKENTVLTSPINGVVSARNYDNGDMCNGQLPVLVVEQISPVKMKVNISESDYTMVNKDLDIAMTFDALGREKFEGNVDIIYPTINAATHTFPVQITVKNEDLKVRPGMYGKAVVNFGSQKHVVVPDMAVKKQAGSGDFYVYTYEDGIVKHNKVKLGRRMGNRYELISGVKPGAYVVVAGVEKLVDGIEVEVINKEQDKK